MVAQREHSEARSSNKNRKIWLIAIVIFLLLLLLLGLFCIFRSNSKIKFENAFNSYLADNGIDDSSGVSIDLATLISAGYLNANDVGDYCPDSSYIKIVEVDGKKKYEYSLQTGCDAADSVSIVLNGESVVNIQYGMGYVEYGANVLAGGKNINQLLVIDSDAVNTDLLGTYKVTYTAKFNNQEYTKTRTVRVIDTTPPVITLSGSSTVAILQGAGYIEAGYSAFDNLDGDLTHKVEVTGNVDSTRVGSYVVSYKVVDSSGNHTTVERVVNVMSSAGFVNPPDTGGGDGGGTVTNVPTLSLQGEATIYLEYPNTYIEPGFIATNGNGEIETSSVSVTSNIGNTLGRYTVIYSYTTSGVTLQATREVIIRDTTPPVISLNGSNVIYQNIGTAFSDPGVVISDNHDTGLNPVIIGSVDHTSAGQYLLTYEATDASGNKGVTQRTVIVEDTEAPVLSIAPSELALTIERGTSYDMLSGITVTDNSGIDLSNYITYTSVPTFDINKNGIYDVTFVVKDLSNNESSPATKTITIVDTSIPTATISYTPAGITASPVTAQITASEDITIPDWSCSANICTKVYTANTTETVTFTDLGNNSNTINVAVTNIDATEFIVTATRNTDALTNQNVKVTLSANKIIQSIPAGWIMVDDYTYYQYFSTNFSGFVEVESEFGEISNVHVSVNNIDNTPITAAVIKTPDGVTDGSVVVKITANKTITTSASGWTCTDNTCEKTFTTNDYESVIVIDAAGNTKTVNIEVENIDVAPPTATVNYSETALTKDPVLVTITANEPIKAISGWTRINETTISCSYNANINTAIEIEDLVGNKSLVDVIIENIDSIPLNVSASYSTESPTKGPVSVIITANKEILPLAGWDKLSETTYTRTFTTNFTGIVNTTDLVGNTKTVVVDVSNIDNTLPTILSYTPDPATPTSGNVILTVVFSEDIKPLAGFNQVDARTYTLEFTNIYQDYVIVFEDLAGNINTGTVGVMNIDRVAPVGAISYSPSQPTNQNVVVTLTTNEEIQDISGWTKVNGKKFTKEYTENSTSESVTFMDIAGNSSTENFAITNIDRAAPSVVSFSKTPETPMVGEVEVTIAADEEITIENWSCAGNVCKASYYANIEEEVVIRDLAGNEVTYSFVIDNIDEEELTADVTYSPELTTKTRGTVEVKITTNRPVDSITGWTKVDNYNFTKIYGENTTEDINFSDFTNKQAFLTITVTNIDRDPPAAQVTYFPTGFTKGSVTATINTEEAIQDIIGWTKINNKQFTKEYSEDTVDSVVISDLAGNTNVVTVNITQIDRTAPNITLIGDTAITINIGSSYIDQGYNVTDNKDQNVTVDRVSTVNPNLIGDYVYSYIATDGAGNSATASRIVRVRDLTPPEILVADNLISYEVGTTIDPFEGVTISDNYDTMTVSDITLTYEGNRVLAPNVAGTYVAIFNACDSSNNCAITKYKTIVVTDQDLPRITLDPSNIYAMEVGSTLPAFAAVAVDSMSNAVDVAISDNIQTTKVGEYEVIFTATDTSNRTATEIRTFRVVDTTPPEIVVRGNSEMTLNYKDIYTELSAIVTDNSGDDLSSNVVITGSVDTDVLGTYYIYYYAIDNSGNQSAIVSRTVHVVDIASPIITVEPDSYIIDVGDDLNIMYGVTAWDNYDGDVTSNIQVELGGFNNANPGTYEISYDVTDSSGNAAETKTRRVRVTGHGIDVVVRSALSCQTYVTCYYPSSSTDNYVYYSGMLWRILNINPDGTVKLIANDVITSLPLHLSSVGSTAYSNLYISSYLNGYFYDRLDNKDILVQNADGTYIDLMTSTEYTTGSGYIGNGSTIWTKTFYSGLRWYFVNTNNALYNSNNAIAYTSAYHGIKPVITVQSDAMVVSGTGKYINKDTTWTTEQSPYILENYQAIPGTTKLSERIVGEYVKFANQTWRITDINDGGNVELILDDLYRVNGAITLRPMDSNATGTNAYFGFTRETSFGHYMDFTMKDVMFSTDDKALIVNDAPWYQTTFSLGSDPLTTSLGKTNAYYNMLGLPRIGELFNTGGESVRVNNNNSYTLNVANGTQMFYINQQTADVAAVNINTSYALRPKVRLNADLVVSSGEGNINSPYEVEATISDDQTAPQIRLTDGDSIAWEVGTPYVEPGYAAYDDKDGDITFRVVVDASDLGLSEIGVRSIIYRVVDSSGNVTLVTRTVNVVDTTKPVLSMDQIMQAIPKGQVYDPLNGVTATDNYDADIQNKITYSPSINTDNPGVYYITYSVMDQSGNVADSIIRTLVISNNTLSSMISNALNCQEYATCYYPSNAVNNYVYYSGMLWRIMRINPDGTVKLIANDVITTLPLHLSNVGATNYSSLYVSSYLNGYFYDKLSNKDVLVQNADGTYVDLMTSTEYTTGSGYIGNGSTLWTKTNYSSTRWYFVNTNNALYNSNNALTFTSTYHGIKPVITIDTDAVVVSGTGEYINKDTVWTEFQSPYIIEQEDADAGVTKVSERTVGEYVKLSGKTWRITNINEGGNAELILDDAYRIDGAITRRPMDSNASETNALFDPTRETSYGYYMQYTMNDQVLDAASQEMVLKEAPWYQSYFAIGSNPLTTAFAKNNEYLNMLGLPRVGELFNVGGEVAKTLNENVYLLNPASGTQTFVVNPTTGDLAALAISNSLALRPKVMLNADIVISGGYGNINNPFELENPDSSDATRPEITLNEGNEIDWEVGTTYVEPGFVAYDNKDGDITHKVIVNVDNLNLSQLGTYYIDYIVQDSHNNVGVVTRTVNVVDTTKPVLSLDQSVQSIPKGSNYNPLNGVTATDNYDQNIQNKITYSPAIDTDVIGTYTVTYEVEDQSQNAATPITRTVIVTNNTLSSMVKSQLSCLDYQTCYYPSASTSNYVYYSGMLWRVLRLNPDNTVRLIANDVITSMPLHLSSVASTSYSDLYISSYLNGYFYDRLSDTDILVQNADGSYVDIMTSSEYTTSQGFISNGSTIWTKTHYSGARWYYVNTNGVLYGSNDASTYTNTYHGIKPIITVSADAVIEGGTGTYLNKDTLWTEFGSPYIIEQDEVDPSQTLLNQRTVGEYVRFANQTWRITDINAAGNVELILDDVYKVNGSVVRRPMDSSAVDTNAFFNPTRETSYGHYMEYTMNDAILSASDRQLVLQQAPWYQSYFSIGSNPLTTALSKTNEYDTQLGLPRIGELFNVGGEVAKTYNENAWTLNILSGSGTQMFAVNQATGLAASSAISSSYLIRPKVILNADNVITSGYGNISDPYEIAAESTNDDTRPDIILTNGNEINWEVKTPYVEPGYYGIDNKDGDITHLVAVDSTNLNLDALGTYEILYRVSDASGNMREVIRTVNVVDTTTPTLTIDQSTQTIVKGSSYDPLNGIYAFDNYDAAIQSKITYTPNIDTDVMGRYTITYSVSDQSNNAATSVSRTLIITDNTLSSMVKSQLSCLDYQTCYYPSASSNNYVYYSGQLWRILRLNPDNTVRLISNDIVTTMPLHLTNLAANASYSSLYVSSYLNGYFYDRLDDTSNLVQNADGTYVDIMTSAEYTTSQGFISNGSTIWTKSYYTGSRWYYVNTNGALYGSNDATTYTTAYHGIKPIITVDASTIITGGSGEYINKDMTWTSLKSPYIIEGVQPTLGTTEARDLTIGEYVNISGKVGRIADIRSDGNVELIMEDIYRYDGFNATRVAWDTVAASGNVLPNFTRETSIGHYVKYIMTDALLDADTRDYIIEDATWYQGTTKSANEDPLTTTLSDFNPYISTVGFARIGELFSVGGENLKAHNDSTYTLSMLNDTTMYITNQQTSNVATTSVTGTYLLRPKVLLKGNMKVASGSGNISNPYTVTP